MKQTFLTILLIFVDIVTIHAQQNRYDSIKSSVVNIMTTYPEATLFDIYKSFYQDHYGPGHLLADTVAAKRYLDNELEQCDTKCGMLFEPTGWQHNFYRVDLSLIKNGMMPKELYFDAFYRSTLNVKSFSDDEWRKEWAEVLRAISESGVQLNDFISDSISIDSMMQAKPTAVHHSRAFNKAYAPHYRIIAKDIFEKELLPLINSSCVTSSVVYRKNKNKVSKNVNKSSRADISPSTLIVSYDSSKAKKRLLSILKKMGAEVIYDYKMMSGMAIKKPDDLSLEDTKSRLEQVEGVVSVSYDHIMQLH